MAQAVTRQMSAVREQHAVHPRRPRPASKPGGAVSASAAKSKGKKSGAEGNSGPRGTSAASNPRGGKRRGKSAGGDGRQLSLPGAKDLPSLRGMKDLPIPHPHFSIWTRLAGKLLKRLAKHQLRKLAKATGERLEGASPGALAKPEVLEKTAQALEKPRDALKKPGEALEKSREVFDFAGVKPTLPIQAAVDIAVPLEFAWRKWIELSFLPEGVDRVVDIERSGAGLSGRIDGGKGSSWNAEILDERDCESFAWKSSEGSDCAGLVTFHRLSERLTRLELTLDVLPQSPIDSASLLLHVADWRARQAMRRFKADLELVSPDVYADDANSQSDNEKNGR